MGFSQSKASYLPRRRRQRTNLSAAQTLGRFCRVAGLRLCKCAPSDSYATILQTPTTSVLLYPVPLTQRQLMRPCYIRESRTQGEGWKQADERGAHLRLLLRPLQRLKASTQSLVTFAV